MVNEIFCVLQTYYTFIFSLDKIRKILNVTTGDSEYMGYISKLGKQIIEEQLHGIIKRNI